MIGYFCSGDGDVTTTGCTGAGNAGVLAVLSSEGAGELQMLAVSNNASTATVAALSVNSLCLDITSCGG